MAGSWAFPAWAIIHNAPYNQGKYNPLYNPNKRWLTHQLTFGIIVNSHSGQFAWHKLPWDHNISACINLELVGEDSPHHFYSRCLDTVLWPPTLLEKKQLNYFTSSDPHHDMLGGGCQVRVVIKNMMGRMENLRTLISGFLGLVILVRWALVTMFLSWTTQTGCRIHRTYVSLIGSGEGRHTTHLLKFVLLLSTSQTDWKQSSDVLSDISFDILSDKSSDISSDILSDISSDILSDIFLTYLLTFFLTNLLTLFLTYLLTFFLTYLSTCFLPYLLTFFLTYQNQNLTSTASQKKPLCKLYIYLAPRSKSNIHDNFVPVNVIALSASDRPAKRQLSPKMQNACSSTHTHTPHASDRPAKRQLSPKMQKSLKCHNYISWRVQTMKSDARHCGACAGSA